MLADLHSYKMVFRERSFLIQDPAEKLLLHSYTCLACPIQIHFIRPLATQPGSIIAFTGAKLPSDPLDIEAVRFIPGGGVCNTLDPSTNQPYGSYVRDNRTWIQCRVEAPPGIYNMSVLVAGVGYAWQHSHAFYLGPAGELTMFEVFPGMSGCAQLRCSQSECHVCFIQSDIYLDSLDS